MLTPIGQLELAVLEMFPLGEGRRRLLPMALNISAVVVQIPPAVIPTISIAGGLLPLTVLAISAVGTAMRLLSLMRLTMPAVSLGTLLGGGESLTIHLRGKGTRLGLGQT